MRALKGSNILCHLVTGKTDFAEAVSGSNWLQRLVGREVCSSGFRFFEAER